MSLSQWAFGPFIGAEVDRVIEQLDWALHHSSGYSEEEKQAATDAYTALLWLRSGTVTQVAREPYMPMPRTQEGGGQ